ncbi:MetQ/NlpA family ABC transporter substrate-binding protein [Alkalibacterium kapii]|uniref:Lipoprotein n=1 Tax=Alkalibacterium kapii TaxID=426704 RepID=A0A511ATG4_9LACT|nr:MetQ/NlpA family ABC transporter substrate-binding protein [Alkalibacterium kapii]GEK91406.1 lipoprotein [Alkalibacterium kapii]
MKKIKGLFMLGSTLLLAACGNGADESQDSQTLTIGASNVPHAEILEFVKPLLEEEGINLEIETYNDYVIPNMALADGDLDANYFQHIPYFETQVAENDYAFTNAGGIHLEPLGAYSKRHSDLSELEEGATIFASNSVSDHGRVLSILSEAELIKVDETVDLKDAGFDDIVENELNLQFEYEYDPALLPTLFSEDEGDVFFINSNFAVDNGLNPVEDSIALESSSSPYANIVAVRSEDKENEKIKKLIELLHSEETQNFIMEKWDGAVIPVDG